MLSGLNHATLKIRDKSYLARAMITKFRQHDHEETPIKFRRT